MSREHILSRNLFGFRKVSTDTHILAPVIIVSSDDRYPKLDIRISEQILGSYEYITVAYITKHCLK